MYKYIISVRKLLRFTMPCTKPISGTLALESIPISLTITTKLKYLMVENVGVAVWLENFIAENVRMPQKCQNLLSLILNFGAD